MYNKIYNIQNKDKKKKKKLLMIVTHSPYNIITLPININV